MVGSNKIKIDSNKIKFLKIKHYNRLCNYNDSKIRN